MVVVLCKMEMLERKVKRSRPRAINGVRSSLHNVKGERPVNEGCPRYFLALFAKESV